MRNIFVEYRLLAIFDIYFTTPRCINLPRAIMVFCYIELAWMLIGFSSLVCSVIASIGKRIPI